MVPSTTIVSTRFAGREATAILECPDEHGQQDHDHGNAEPQEPELHAEDPRGVEEQGRGHRVAKSALAVIRLLRRKELPDRPSRRGRGR